MISLADRSYQQSVTTLEKIREEWQKEHIKACEVNAPKRLHAAAWSSGCPSLAAGVTDGAALPSLHSPGSEAAGCVAANPAFVLPLASGFRVPIPQGFHWFFTFIFSCQHLLKFTESVH